jgi:phosphatidylserine/phosphatidylglycerophosphate/cardiolipin synthase-like enzyme
MLLNANIPIRSGAFHLKTYISEQYAYLGSCNLTGGSLDFNIEAGIISRNNSIHSQLINLFWQFWQQRSRDEVIPTLISDGFHLRSIHHSSQEEYQTYPSLLTPSRYKKDLIEKLINFRVQV